MMALVIGTNGSGKSLYAESLACAAAKGKLYYIATMIPYGEEGLRRVERHRTQREGKGFITLESPYADAVKDGTGTVLLEDVSNLVANLMFEKGAKDVESETLKRINSLSDGCDNLVMVSISGYGEGAGGNDETKAYIRLLSAVNERLFETADVVIEMDDGKPILLKGEKSWAH